MGLQPRRVSTSLRFGALAFLLFSVGSEELLAQSPLSWGDEGTVDSNYYRPAHGGSARRGQGGGVVASPGTASSYLLGSSDRANGHPETSAELGSWYRLPPRTFRQQDGLGSQSFFGSRPLNYGQMYGTEFGPSYFGNFGNAYGAGESRSYFGNYGIGYGFGEGRKF